MFVLTNVILLRLPATIIKMIIVLLIKIIFNHGNDNDNIHKHKTILLVAAEQVNIS